MPGSLKFVLARWLLSILVMLPGVLAGSLALSGGPGAEPYFGAAPQPFPLLIFVEFVGRLPGAMWALLVLGAGAVWVGNQLLTAGAVTILRRARRDPRVWRATIDTGRQHFWPYVRIAAVAGIWLVVAVTVTNRAFAWLADHGTLAGWSGQTLVLTLPLVRALVLLALASAIGAIGLWCRVVVVSGQRRCVRRLHQIVPKLVWRAPLQGLLLPMVLACVSLGVGAFVVFAWRQSGTGHLGVWLPAWFAVLFGQAYVWHWRVRTCVELADAGLATAWTSVPDSPWHVFRRLWRALKERLLRRRAPAQAAAATPSPTGGTS